MGDSGIRRIIGQSEGDQRPDYNSSPSGLHLSGYPWMREGLCAQRPLVVRDVVVVVVVVVMFAWRPR